METRYGNLDRVIAELRFSVKKTLEAFKQTLQRTHYIKVSGQNPKPEPMRDRVNLAINLAGTARDATALVDLCKLIPEWKREATLIVERVREVIRRADAFVRTGVRPASFVENLVVQGGTGGSMHFMLETPSYQLQQNSAPLKAAIRRYKQNIVKDEAALPALLQPIVIS